MVPLIRLLFASIVLALSAPVSAETLPLRWQQLPPIPDAEGFAGAFAGVSRGALLVAGGANVAAKRWQPDFVKSWHDRIFVLETGETQWREFGQLPRACAYGVSIDAGNLLCIGGGDATENFADVFTIHYKYAALVRTPLPSLPQPCAMMCGARVGDTVYIAGGLQSPTATRPLNTFWSFDLNRREAAWRELPPCPGPARILAVAASHDGAFFIFSGAKLSPGPDGKPVREYLRDAWRFAPDQGWKRLADLPRAAVAAPSPAPVVDGRVLVISGDDGANVKFSPAEDHPGFPREVLAYDVAGDSWSTAGEAPFSRATVPVVKWRNQFVIPNGEVRPRVRTPEVWALQLP